MMQLWAQRTPHEIVLGLTELSLQGSHQVTIFNMADRVVRNGPDMPIRNNHAMGAMFPDGRMHVLMSESYLLRSENASDNGWVHHYVWDFAGGEAADCEL